MKNISLGYTKNSPCGRSWYCLFIRHGVRKILFILLPPRYGFGPSRMRVSQKCTEVTSTSHLGSPRLSSQHGTRRAAVSLSGRERCFVVKKNVDRKKFRMKENLSLRIRRLKSPLLRVPSPENRNLTRGEKLFMIVECELRCALSF